MPRLLRKLAAYLERRGRPRRPPIPPPYVHEPGDEERAENALEILDSDTEGYVLLLCKSKGTDGGAWVKPVGQVGPDWWPAVVECCERIVAQARA